MVDCFVVEVVAAPVVAAPAPVMGAERSCIDCGDPISPDSRGRCIECHHASMVRPMPDGFEQMICRYGSYVTSRMLRASLSTISRWRKEIGISGRRGPQHMRGKSSGVQRVVGAQTRAESAADHLRSQGPVYRCGKDGKPDPKAGYWRRGAFVLTDDEIIARATRHGWTG